MITTITVCMSGTYEHVREAFDKHNLPTREMIQVVGGHTRTTAELPDSDEVRAKLKDLAAEYHATLLAVSVTTVYA